MLSYKDFLLPCKLLTLLWGPLEQSYGCVPVMNSLAIHRMKKKGSLQHNLSTERSDCRNFSRIYSNMISISKIVAANFSFFEAFVKS